MGLISSHKATAACETLGTLTPFRNHSVLVKAKPIVGLQNKIRKIGNIIRLELKSKPTLLDLIPEAELQPLIQSSVSVPKSFILRDMYGEIVRANGYYHVFMNPKGELMVGDQILPESLVPSAISSMTLVKFEDGRIEKIQHIVSTSDKNRTPDMEVESLHNLLAELKARGFTKEDFQLPDKTVFRVRATDQIVKVMGPMSSFDAHFNKVQIMNELGLTDPRSVEISHITNRHTTITLNSEDSLRELVQMKGLKIDDLSRDIKLTEKNLYLLGY